MAKNNNLTDFLTDIANAIRTKKGTTAKINPQNFSAEIASIEGGGGGGDTPSRPKWTGHADAEGLRAIGWTDEDIAFYQQHGVNWNAEDDEYHKVTDDNKALYGVLTIDNIADYKDRIVYLPKIDTSSVMDMDGRFANCYSLVAIPVLDTSFVSYANNVFQNCYSLVAIPPLNFSRLGSMRYAFENCYSLVYISSLQLAYSTDMRYAFRNCYSLVAIPPFNLNYYADNAFDSCHSLVYIPFLDIDGIKNTSSLFYQCNSLTYASIKNIAKSISFKDASLLSKESILYLINNEASTSAITITLARYAYERLATDADVVEALTNHPNISLAQ